MWISNFVDRFFLSDLFEHGVFSLDKVGENVLENLFTTQSN